MSWTFSIVRADGSPLSATIRNPDWGDLDQRIRRQARGETEAGIVFVQDHGREDQILQGTWNALTFCEKSDLLTFFGEQGSLYQARPFDLTLDSGDTPVGVSTEQGWSTADGLTTGELAVAPLAVFGSVYLDQPSLQFRTQQDNRYGLALQLRVAGSTAQVT